MADTPKLRSPEQIYGDLVDGFLSRARNVTDLSRQSVLNQLIKAVSESNFKAVAEIIQSIDSLNIDRAVGESLQRLARDRNVPILSGRYSSGLVDITDTSFEKIETAIFAGQPAPVSGSQVLYVVDASDFSPTGKIYIGRGTPNVEGPLDYTSVAPQSGGSYWAITLAGTSLTTKYHNIGEKVIFAQGGDRLIRAGAAVKTASGSNADPVTFKTTSNATIRDGETIVYNVPVICDMIGPDGNIPKGAIRETTAFSFDSVATNQQPFTNGVAPDNDDTLRARIKAYEQAKSKGTEAAVRYSAIDVVSDDDKKRVTSSNIVRYSDLSSALIFDDGTGYEPIFSGVGIERVIDKALGGETNLQLRQYPIAQARVINNIEGPYNIPNGYIIDVEIQGVRKSHTFLSADFKVAGAATVSEVVDSINSDPNFHAYATTAINTSRIALYPKDKSQNEITVKSRDNNDANSILGFPINIEYTLRLYKNDLALYQDGLVAKISTSPKANWVNTIMSGDTLVYSVDGAPNITATFTTDVFQSVDLTSSVSYFTSIEIWAAAMNKIMAGTTATVNGDVIEIASNLGQNSRASIEIIGGTLYNKMFPSNTYLYAAGRSSDYTLNRETGQLELAMPLATNDTIATGSSFTRSKISTASIPSGPIANGNVWLVSDGSAQGIPNGLRLNTTVYFEEYNSNPELMRIYGQSPSLALEGFSEVQIGDWVLIWGELIDSGAYPAMYANRGFWRVEQIDNGIVVKVGASGVTTGNNFGIPLDRIVIVRSTSPIQHLSYTVGTIGNFINTIKSQLIGIDAEAVGSSVRLATQTSGLEGELFIAAADAGARSIGFSSATTIENITSHYGFVANNDAEAGTPLFIHSEFGTKTSDTVFGEPDYIKLGGSLDNFAEVLNDYETSPSAFQELVDSNKSRRAYVQDYNSTSQNITLDIPQYLTDAESPIQESDRYFLRESYQFDANDQVTFIIDGDNTTKTYNTPVSRTVKVNSHSTPSAQDFSADDTQSSLDLADPSSFYNFDFSDFKVWRQASATLTQGSASIKLSSIDFGPSGDSMRVGFVYPTNNSQTSLSYTTLKNETGAIGIRLPISNAKVANWDGTTAFTTSVSNTGGRDSVTYTYRVGTQPDFGVTGSDINVGDIAMIDPTSNFLQTNKDISAKISNVTSTSFTIERPTGTATSDNIPFVSMINQGGLTTVASASPHGITDGDRIGFWSTGSIDGIQKPFETTYFANVLNPTEFTVSTPTSVPSGAFNYAASGPLATITSTNPHGLQAGNVIIISNTANINGTKTVYSVIGANQFTVVSSYAGSEQNGKFDFQSYSQDFSTSFTASSISKTGTTVTVNCSGHTFVANQIVNITGATWNTYAPATTYGIGDIVKYSGIDYISKTAANIGNQPDISPLAWEITTLTLNGNHAITSATAGVSFQFRAGFAGNGGTSSGTATAYSPSGRLARCIGSSSSKLQFGEITTTAQDIIDYITTSMSDIMLAKLTSGSGAQIINTSTADQGVLTNYYSAVASNISAIMSSNMIEVTVNSEIVAGSDIILSSSNYSQYDDQYVVLKCIQSGSNYILTLRTGINSATTFSAALTGGTVVGSNTYKMMRDGENWVKSSNLLSAPTLPQFTMKRSWSVIPSIDEEIKLIANTNDQLSRFWNILSVTGLSNVANIDDSRYGRQLQVRTKTFGSSGSVQAAGGTASSGQIALVGAGSEQDTTVGSFTIPYAGRKGINAKSWLKLTQTVRQNKSLGFAGTTQLQVYNDGIEIMNGTAGSFQQKRTTTQADGTRIKIERHGDYVAFIGIDGASLGLRSSAAQFAREGDWVRIKNKSAPSDWNSLTTYPSNAKVNYDGYVYRNISGSSITGGDEPNISSDWRKLGFNFANAGIFQVVRTFGDNTFWIENVLAIDEIIEMSDSTELEFYSYDSIMPGDTVVITGNKLNSLNVGRYIVLDESTAGYAFPTSTRIYTATIPVAVSTTVLGDSFTEFNIEEYKPLSLLKRVITISPISSDYANVIVDSYNLMNKMSSALGASAIMLNKLNYSSAIQYGVDSYRYYKGLIKQLNKVIYGDSFDPINYPGVRAAGTAIEIKPAILKKISVALSVRIKSGIPFIELRDRIKAVVAGYVNSLGVGEQVSLSRIVDAASKINGVVSVVITSPTYDISNDLIYIGLDQRAAITDATNDVIVSILGN